MKTYFNKVGIVILLMIVSLSYSSAQIGINTDGATPDSSAILDIASSDKGVLVPRMSTDARGAIDGPADGLLVYDIDTGSFWYYENDQWNEIGTRRNVLLQDADADTQQQLIDDRTAAQPPRSKRRRKRRSRKKPSA